MSTIRKRRLSSEDATDKTVDIVEDSFWRAMERTGLSTPREYTTYMKGWPIRFAVETLCNKLMPYAKENEIRKKVEESYGVFRKNLENYCKMHKVRRNIRAFLMHPDKLRIYTSPA